MRRDILIKGLNSIPGIRCVEPDGAFYAFANIIETGLSGQEMMNLLLDKARIAVLDGEYFGRYGEGYIRLCYASTSVEMIEEAIEGMKNILEQKNVKSSTIYGGE